MIALSSDELRALAETLDTPHLRSLLSQRRRSRAGEETSELPRRAATLGRDELIAEVVTACLNVPSIAHRLCETVTLPPKKARRWLADHEPDAPAEWIDRVIAMLTASARSGQHPALIPAHAVVSVLTTGLETVIKELREMERGRGGAVIDFRAFQIERHRREEVRALLDGLGTPEREEFHPDDFQLDAVDFVTHQGVDVMVSAPTGSGKTWIAEQSIRRTLEEGGTAWYTSPLKALSNDKFREFGRIFGPENVGLITGDRKVNPDAKIKIATTEIYRNGLYDVMNGISYSDSYATARLVVFDEVHYLGDRERGVVWEESIIYTPASTRILMLSATVGNAQELADWVAWTRGVECRLVLHPERPVPLRTAFVQANGRLQPLFEDLNDSQRLHPDIHNLYQGARQTMSERKSQRKPFYRRRRK